LCGCPLSFHVDSANKAQSFPHSHNIITTQSTPSTVWFTINKRP
jgi:hypothetical protein